MNVNGDMRELFLRLSSGGSWDCSCGLGSYGWLWLHSSGPTVYASVIRNQISVGLTKRRAHPISVWCANACTHGHVNEWPMRCNRIQKLISTLTLCSINCSGIHSPLCISICGNKHNNISDMHVNSSLSNQIESLWSKYLFSYSPAVYNTVEGGYINSVSGWGISFNISAWPAYARYRKPIASVAPYRQQRSKAREGQRCHPPFSSWSALTSSPCPISSRWLTRPQDRCPHFKTSLGSKNLPPRINMAPSLGHRISKEYGYGYGWMWGVWTQAVLSLRQLILSQSTMWQLACSLYFVV